VILRLDQPALLRNITDGPVAEVDAGAVQSFLSWFKSRLGLQLLFSTFDVKSAAPGSDGWEPLRARGTQRKARSLRAFPFAITNGANDDDASRGAIRETAAHRSSHTRDRSVCSGHSGPNR
jgi:hypothetical protein